MSETLTAEHVTEICKPGTYDCCRYLGAGAEGFCCLKLNPGFKKLLDDRVTAGTIRATGDNCEGIGEQT